MFETFPDSDGVEYSVTKIIKVGPSIRRPDRDGKVVYEHEVWLEGLEYPVWVDWQIVEGLQELGGTAISALPGFFVVDFDADLSSPTLVAVVGWRISARHCERIIPVTLNGNNNGRLGVAWPILQPDGSVDDYDRSFPSLDACRAAYAEARENA